MVETRQSIAELERMHHAAARIGRMGEDRDAEALRHANASAGAQPMRGSRAKFQIVSADSPSLMTTR